MVTVTDLSVRTVPLERVLRPPDWSRPRRRWSSTRHVLRPRSTVPSPALVEYSSVPTLTSRTLSGHVDRWVPAVRLRERAPAAARDVAMGGHKSSDPSLRVAAWEANAENCVVGLRIDRDLTVVALDDDAA